MSLKQAKGKGSNMFSQRRIELGFTQDYVARYLDVKPRTFQNWEAQGYPGPLPLNKVEKLCALYKWTFEQLVRACYPEPLDNAAEPSRGTHYKANGGMA